MIRGYFSPRNGKNRPFVLARFTFTSGSSPHLGLRTHLIVDTGADRTMLAPSDSKVLARLGIVLNDLPRGPTSTGIGGKAETRITEAVLTLESTAIPLALTIIEPPPNRVLTSAVPSLLGRDVLSQFALFMEERTGRLFLLDPSEADALEF